MGTAEGERADAAGGGGRTRPIHVLVVDDSAVAREIMTALFSPEPDMRVTVASDLLIAIARMRAARPDVIVLDLEMPRMDGSRSSAS